MENETLRIALVGCGNIAPLHLSAIQKSGNTLVALCDIVEERAEKMREQYAPDAKVYTDINLLLANEQIDILHICLPHHLHAPVICEALSRDINVLCEKPLCIDEKQHKMILKAKKKSKAQLGVCFQNRYQPVFLELKKYLTGKDVKNGTGSVIWKRDASYYRADAWRGKWDTEGGGVLINQALHTLDLLLYLTDKKVKIGKADLSNRHLKGVIETEDTADLLFRAKDGTCLSFFATTAGDEDHPIRITLSIEDERYVRHNISATNQLLDVQGEFQYSRDDIASLPGKAVWGNCHEALINDYYRCVKTGTHFAIDETEGAKALLLLFEIYKKGKKKLKK